MTTQDHSANIMDKSIDVSICIPAFECGGEGVSYLKTLLDSIQIQTHEPFEVIISDHSKSDELEKLCESYSFNIKHHYNSENRGSCEANLNNAVRLSSGNYIKPMLQDDFFIGPDSLELMVNAVRNTGRRWVAAHTMHCTENDVENLHSPHPAMLPLDPKIWLAGVNTLGGPSVVLYPRMDEEYNPFLVWLMDVEYYYKLWMAHGHPALVNEKCIVTRLRDNGISATEITQDVIAEDTNYCVEQGLTNQKPNIENYPLMLERAQRLNLI